MSLQVSPSPPETFIHVQDKAVTGLRYYVKDIDERIRGLYKTIDESSFFRWLINKLGLGRESRQIKALKQEKTKVENAITNIFKKPLEIAVEQSHPKKLQELCEEKKVLEEGVKTRESKVVNLQQEYREALFFRSLFELGLGDEYPEDSIRNMDLLRAELQGLEYSLSRCRKEIQAAGQLNAHTVKAQAEEALKSATDPGQRVLLTEMKKYPGILAEDISRQGKVTIGGKELTLDKDLSNSPAYVRYEMAEAIRSYVSSKNKELALSDETVTELLFSLVQQLLMPLFLKVSLDSPVSYQEGEGWASVSGIPGRKVSFEMENGNTPKVIVVTVQDERLFVRMKNEDEKKAVFLELQTHYNLETKEVIFYQSYTIDGVRTQLEPTKDLFGKSA